MRKEATRLLTDLGIKIQGDKVCIADLQKVFGAVYQQPEWLQAADLNLNIPKEYEADLQEDVRRYGWIANPATYTIARYGKFLDYSGKLVVVDGLVYHYVRKTNPQNVGCGYKLYLDGKCYGKNSSIPSPAEAKLQCNAEAEALIKTLIDPS